MRQLEMDELKVNDIVNVLNHPAYKNEEFRIIYFAWRRGLACVTNKRLGYTFVWPTNEVKKVETNNGRSNNKGMHASVSGSGFGS